MAQAARIWTRDAQQFIAPSSEGPIPVIMACDVADPTGTVLLVHGRNGAPHQPHIAEIAASYLARGWRVVAPELPHSAALPDSGPPDRVTFTGHCHAAAAAFAWATEHWPEPKHALAGHSIGAFAVAHLGADNDRLHHILAVSPALSGRALLTAREAMGPDAVAEVEREAPLFRAEMETEDAAPALARTRVPLAVVTGAEDGLVPLKHARAYFAAAGNARFFGAVPGEHHCPAGPACGAMLSAALDAVEA
ncbi:alpha/beta fold hydrolase [Tropicimonas marinistellae]|uniref:alpha/beta fold hydrolase n=1 Tax=Tropicimonas marinistellae TaxID=1739787 RepID=UPI00082DE705|nr:alpha/beta fold hydrolase [Tropicimonas marinistellae]